MKKETNKIDKLFDKVIKGEDIKKEFEEYQINQQVKQLKENERGNK